MGYGNGKLLHTCSVLWFSSPKQLMRSKVPTMSVMAASWALESEMASS